VGSRLFQALSWPRASARRRFSLVYLAEREGIEAVFTLDVRDFSVYRTATGKALRIVPTT
jgi:hypothetical protein